ncbi:hypothetical protein GCM10028824_05670 [Hymenobacter segetis]|uniref:Cyanobacterial TRADD-N associated 2 transmembrane domain-containing protein n=1 Tax=Hymenobacter segetis TaxID=2025509 RepID=A0ABU9LXP3_9BACT
MFEKLGQVIFFNKKIRNATLFINLLAIVSGITLLIYLTLYGTKEQLSYYVNFTSIFFFIIPIITAFSFISYLISSRKGVTEIELDKIHQEREEITQKIEDKNDLDIFNTIQLSLNQLNEYYAINKGQARSSFMFSIFAIVIGLITILGGIWLKYFEVIKIEVTYLTTIAGVISEFIGAAYFFMYKKSIEQVNLFFGQLIKIQDTMLSINLAKNNPNAERRSNLEERIILSLLERSLK